jgi:hypothetical protein
LIADLLGFPAMPNYIETKDLPHPIWIQFWSQLSGGIIATLA